LHKKLEQLLTVRDAFGNRYSAGNEALHEMARRGEAIKQFELELDENDNGTTRLLASADVVGAAENGNYRLVLQLQPERRRNVDLVIRGLLNGFRIDAESDSDLEPELEGRGGNGHQLTSRQAEVLSMLADGQHVDEIAEKLNLSVCTVRRHLQNALSELGAHSQAEAVATAIRKHLI
jgi:DNA-binding CsgD family transcriptional regulator